MGACGIFHCRAPASLVVAQGFQSVQAQLWQGLGLVALNHVGS